MVHFLLDGDGVLWRGGKVMPHAAELLGFLRERGIGYSYVSNNSSRRRSTTLEWFRANALPFEEGDIFNTNYLAGHHLEKHHKDERVLVIGHRDLSEEIRSRGVQVVIPSDLLPPATMNDPGLSVEAFRPLVQSPFPSVVIVGIDTSVCYASIALACWLIEDGAAFISTNRDYSFPAEQGYLLPGNGAVVDLIARVSGHEPLNLGKPEPHLAELIAEEKGVSHADMVMVGDRLETDIAFASRNGMRSVLLLTGVAGMSHQEEDARHEGMEPTFVVKDLPELIARFDGMFGAAK